MRFACGLVMACLTACAPEASPRPAAAPARDQPPPAALPDHLEARRRVSWGYGCGGNCAQNTRGESRVTIDVTGELFSAQDAGETTTTHSSPGSVATEKRTWSFQWHGHLTGSDDAMTLALTADAQRCTDAEDRGTGAARQTACKHLPAPRMALACAADQVDATGAKRRVWRCEPDPPVPAGEWSGTPFPWVFGIDDPIDTVDAGEPQPSTSYEVRP
jgi:hypothetical protein